MKRVLALGAGWLLAASAVHAQGSATEVIVHNFGIPLPGGLTPCGGVIRDSAGSFYGTAQSGGTSPAFAGSSMTPGLGVVFKMSAAGKETVLHNFAGGADGSEPCSGVIADSAGNLYGTTSSGGPANDGIVFKLSPSGAETILYAFTGGADGGRPGSLIRDSAGNLYGNATEGALGYGVVFSLDPAGQESVLYTFTGGDDGAYPSPVTADSAGNLYGTAEYGGTAGFGVVFKLDPSGHETVLYNFSGGADGAYPGTVTLDASGNLYGTALYGAASGAPGPGVIFGVSPAGQETVLYTFPDTGSDGADPIGALILDAAGALYGATTYGGTNDAGVVFKLDPGGQLSILYRFTGGADGGFPSSGLFADPEGNLYGTTSAGGAEFEESDLVQIATTGVVYKLDTDNLETAVSFPLGVDGANADVTLISDTAGNLYGTAPDGGTGGLGVVFKISPDGQESILYTFAGGVSGEEPSGGLSMDDAGNFYGMANGGAAGQGIVYKVDPAGNETVLYAFTGGADGGMLAQYSPTLLLDAAGNIYGTTYLGGTANSGVVFKLDPSGNETVLYTFDGIIGSLPGAGVIADSEGNLYGTTIGGNSQGSDGTVFKLSPAGLYSVLYSFTGKADGGEPFSLLTLDAAGNLYGTAKSGGLYNHGVVYKISPAGVETALYSFKEKADGGHPVSGVIEDAAGELYGTTCAAAYGQPSESQKLRGRSNSKSFQYLDPPKQ